MLDIVFTTLNSICILFLFIISGFVLRRTKVVSEAFGKNIASLLVNMMLPALILDVMLKKLNLASLREEYVSFLLAAVIIILSWVIFSFIGKRFYKQHSARAVFLFAMIFSNFGFMGQPVVEAIYGESAMLVWALYTIPYYSVVNILAPVILDPNPKKGGSWRVLLSPTIFCIIIGVVCGLAQIRLPSVVDKFITLSGATVVPLSMVLMGFVLGGQPLRRLFVGWQPYIISLLRLLIIPLAVFLALYAIGFRGLHLCIPVLISGMPIAVNGVMTTEDLGADSLAMAQAVFITTVLSLVTLPVIAGLLSLVA